jgi:hypothetical protein
MKQPSLFPVVPDAVEVKPGLWVANRCTSIFANCVHGVSITWKPRECPLCLADPGDAPKGQ